MFIDAIVREFFLICNHFFLYNFVYRTINNEIAIIVDYL